MISLFRGAPIVAILLEIAACQGNAELQAPRTHVVEMRGFGYQPATIRVSPGDTIVWVNRDAVPHTATDSSGVWDSGSIAAGESWRRAVEESGETSYYCTFHPTMRGRIVLQ